MNPFIETLNQWGGNFLSFAWPMLWQSSLMITVLFALDMLFRRKLRASLRYTLWLVVLVKLCVPPTFALPTSPAWWLHKTPPPVVAKALPHYTVTYDNGPLPEVPQTPLPAFVPPKLVMTNAAWLLVASIACSSALLCWLFVRWWQVARMVRSATATERFSGALDKALRQAGTPVSDPACSSSFLKRAGSETGIPNAGRNLVRLKIVERRISPAVCGLLRPVILLPRELVEILSPTQLHAVLLHELIHLRRRDVWLNFVQALLQIVYWWHPLVWLANARIRRVREEAVDDAVMLALRDEAEAYAPTLLEVAKLALNRPLATLGLVGILESRSALRQRIERLVDFRPPRRAGLTLVSLLGILAFTVVAVPMGEGPAPVAQPASTVQPVLPPAVVIQNTNMDQTTVSGILADPNFRVVLKALEQRSGAEPLAEPEVTTTSGRGRNRIAMATISVPISTNNDSQLVREGKLLYEMGKLDDSESKLKAALSLDAENAAAKYYLGVVQAARQTPKLIYTGEGRQGIIWKLQTIRLERVAFDAVPLGEVVRTLGEESQQRDPDRRGINFLVNPDRQQIPMPTIDPLTGLPMVISADNRSHLLSLPITINPPLTNLSLGDVLDALVKAAPEPIKYSVQDYAIVFSAGKSNALALYARHFRVDPNAFMAALKALTPALQKGSIMPTNDMSVLARNFFSTLGVNLDPTTPGGLGKSLYYKDRLGELFVRATTQDLDTIENALEVINRVAPPPQIHIKARFLEVPKGTLDGLKNIIAVTNLPAISNEVAGLVGILTDKNFKTLWPNLEARPDVEALAEPEVETTSGRQTQMRATRLITVVTNYAFLENKTNGGVAIAPQTCQIETGPVLDVVPYVLSDGYAINLRLNPSLTEFLGYETPPTNAIQHINDFGDHLPVMPVILPSFRVRQVVATLNLWDGQTVILRVQPEKTSSWERRLMRNRTAATRISWSSSPRRSLTRRATASIQMKKCRSRKREFRRSRNNLTQSRRFVFGVR